MQAFRRLYGRDGPGHLVAMLVTYAITAYAVWAIFQNAKPWTVLLWLALAIIAHDFVFLPLYTGAYRLARRIGGAEPDRRRVIALQHVAVPLMVSLLVLLAALPLIFSLSPANYRPTTGMTQEPYLERWLVFTGALFVLSAIVYAIRMRRARSDRQATTPALRPRR